MSAPVQNLVVSNDSGISGIPVSCSETDVTLPNGQLKLQPTSRVGVYEAEINGERIPVYVEADGVDVARVSMRGYTFTCRVLREDHHQLLAIIQSSSALQARPYKIATPMPGMLKAVFVENGAEVKKGQALFTLEAMKMENSIASPINGIVHDVTAVEGQALEKGFRLCTIEPLR